MAIIYVDSNAAGLNDGSTWTDAYTTLQAALTAWTTADRIWVEHDHNEVISANTTFTCGNATASDPVIIVSMDSSDDSYSPKRGNKGVGGTSNYQLDNTTNWNIFYWNFSSRVFGMSIKCNRQFRCAVSASHNQFIDCDFRTTPTAAASASSQYFGTTAQFMKVQFFDCDFSGTNDFYFHLFAGKVEVYGGSVDYSSDNAGLGLVYMASGGSMEIRGTDMSTCTGFDAIFHTSGASRPHYQRLYQCALPSGVTISGAKSTQNGDLCVINGCDSSTAYERSEYHMNSGDVITTNSVYADASSAHYASNNQFSYEMTPGADCDAADPLWFEFLVGVAETTGSKTFTIELAHDFTSSLTDTDIHAEFHFGGTSNSSGNTMESSSPTGMRDPEGAGTTLTTSTVGWTGAGGLTKQKIEKTVTVNRIGPVYARVCLNTYEATKSVYVNSEIDIT